MNSAIVAGAFLSPPAHHEDQIPMSSRPSPLALPDTNASESNDTSLTSYLSSAHVARYLGISPDLLRVWRARRIGPPYYKMPGQLGAVYYRESDVLAFMQSRYVLTDRVPNIRPGPLRKPKKTP